jgi:hypothetical protein
MHDYHFENKETALNFLKELITEYNTQDNMITATPYFIVIRDPIQDEDGGRVETLQKNMFLTHKAAQEHLRANHYHYSQYVQTYLDHAWRNPEFEKLLEAIGLVAGVEYERK